MFSFLDDFKPYGHWLLRIALGSVFVIHGIGNFMNLTGFVATLNVPHMVGLTLVVAEIVGGILVLSGGFMDDKSMAEIGMLVATFFSRLETASGVGGGHVAPTGTVVAQHGVAAIGHGID